MSQESDEIDPGLAAIAEIWQIRWRPEEKWTEPLPRGFAWYPHRLRHELIAGPVFEDLGSQLSLVQSRLKVVDNIQQDRALVMLALSVVNRQAISSALCFDQDTRSVWSLSSMLVHQGTLQWRPAYYASLAMIQAAQMERVATSLAEAIDGEVAIARHPGSGMRQEADPRLSYYDQICTPAELHSEFESAQEFAELEGICPQIGLATFGAEGDGIAAEMEFGGDTALIQLHANQPHPVCGAGLLFTLRLPIAGSADDAMEWAAALNLYEAKDCRKTHLQGAWTVEERSGKGHVPAYSGFRPGTLYRPGIIKDEFFALVMRLRGLRETLYGDATLPVEPVGIILKRLGALH
jgi:hypothetical protein